MTAVVLSVSALARHDASPVVAVNRAVAVAHAEGAEAGLRRLASWPNRLETRTSSCG